MIKIQWLSGPAAGSSDLIPEDLFRNGAKAKEAEHEVRWSGRTTRAKFHMDVSKDTADLNYEATPEIIRTNKRRELIVGTMRIRFDSARRNRITGILWKREGGNTFDSTTVVVEYILHDPDSIEGNRVLRRHVLSERDPLLVRRKKQEASSLKCEVANSISIVPTGNWE